MQARVLNSGIVSCAVRSGEGGEKTKIQRDDKDQIWRTVQRLDSG